MNSISQLITGRCLTSTSVWLFPVHLVLYLLFVCGLFLGALVYVEYTAHDRDLKLRLANENSLIRLSETMLTRDLQVIASDLFILAESEELLRFLDNRNVQNLRALENRFLRFANDRQYYDHIAFINKKGKEEARVNTRDGESVRVPSNQLQNKSGLSFVSETRELPKGHLYVSPLDLNIEFGKIEEPYKPSIRVVTPVFNRYNHRRGIIVLNYKGEYMLNRLHEHLSDDQRRNFFILNADGFWVDALDKSILWSFMFNSEHAFSRSNPLDWEVLSEQGQGQYISANGAFVFSSIDPRKEMLSIFDSPDEEETSAPKLFLVSQVPADKLAFHYRQVFSDKYREIILIGFILALILSWQLARTNVIRTEANQSLKALAISDPLTGICNRRYFMEQAETELSRSLRYDKQFSLLLLDIDHFKKINDRYGHQIGDEAILHLVKLVKRSLRSSDSFARYGGEEFVIGLPETSLEEAGLTCERIRSLVEENPLEIKHDVVPFTVSIGCTERNSRETDISQLLKRADTALYQAKQAGRNQVVLI